MERNILDFIDHHVEVVRDVDRAAAEAHWRTLTEPGEDARLEYEARREELAAIYRDREHYARFRAYDEEGTRTTPGLERQLRVLRLRFAREQIPADARARLTESADSIARRVRTWRVAYDDRSMPLAEARRQLCEARDESTRRRTWEACMDLGEALGPDVIRLIGVRNRVARDLNFADFHTLSCRLEELDDSAALLRAVRSATDPHFAELRSKLDGEIRACIDAAPDDLNIWHFDGLWAESVPGRPVPDFDDVLGNAPIETARKLFRGVGLDIDPVLADGAISVEATHGRRAELVLTDRDTGQTRLQCVVGTDGAEFDRLIAFLVRALATRSFDASLPWVLRAPPHDIVLDAIARMLSRMARSREFLSSLKGGEAASLAETASARGRHDLLRMRTALAVAAFEHDLYADPGQDLTRRWWETFGGLLGLRRPQGRRARFDWATHLELTTEPLRARREILTVLAEAQLTSSLADQLGGAEWGRTSIGARLTEGAFAPGRSLDWAGAVENLTGKPLGPTAWIAAVTTGDVEPRS